jgi:hypothetical protein
LLTRSLLPAEPPRITLPTFLQSSAAAIARR